MEYKLSALQRGYLSGRSIHNRLGGAPCHVYIEAGGKSISISRLKDAWKKVLNRHPLLRCKSSEFKFLVDHEKSPNEYVQVFDFSLLEKDEAEAKREKIREEFSGRAMRTEYGQTCGLGVMKLPDEKDILFFDFDLTAGDVYSFQIILSDLVRFYCGKLNDEVITPYFAESQVSENKKQVSENDLNAFFGCEDQFACNAESLFSCKYKSLRFSYPKEFWADISSKISDNISAEDVWCAVSALVIHRICDKESFFMNVPHFRSDIKSVSDNTELYLVRSSHYEKEKFGDYIDRLMQEMKKWQEGDYPDGFEYQMSLQKNAPEGSWIAPFVFSSTKGIMLLTEEFEKTFGNLEYMVSQTPQVWIDMQYFILPQSTEIFWMIPQGLFDENVIEKMSELFRETAEKLRDSDAPADLYV